MTTYDAEAPVVVADPADRWSARVLRFIGKAPIQILLIFVALLWLVPTFGLFLTSLLSPADFSTEGWWQVFSEPSKITWSNYEAIFDNETLMSSLVTTIVVALLTAVIGWRYIRETKDVRIWDEVGGQTDNVPKSSTAVT